MRIQTTAIKAPASAVQAKQSRRATRWQRDCAFNGYSAISLDGFPAWLRPDFNELRFLIGSRCSLLPTSWEKGDL